MDSREESIVEMKRIGAWATYVSKISTGPSNRSSDPSSYVAPS